MGEGVQGRIEDRLQHRRFQGGQSIVHPDPIAAGFDQAGVAQVGEMARDRRLRELQATVNVAHAHFPVAEERQNPESGLVGQGTKHLGQVRRGTQARRRSGGAARSILGLQHICLDEYITTHYIRLDAYVGWGPWAVGERSESKGLSDGYE
jgi:hypothetical protein